MIDPTDVTKFDRTPSELQEFWLFCITVAGKTAVTQAKHLEIFLNAGSVDPTWTPFDVVEQGVKNGTLMNCLQHARLGQYTKLEKAFTQSLGKDLETCTVADLETIHGVGAKTARYFILHSRKDQRLAVLDTHVLKHMRALGLTTLTGTPGKGKLYEETEAAFLALADASGLSPAEYDLWVWNQYARKA